MSNEIVKKKNSVPALMANESVKERVNELLGKRSAQFTSTVIAISRLPHLKDCDPNSILGAAITAATLNLPVNQNLGFAYIVPYKNKGKSEAQFQMGYKGFIQLALRSGKYAQMNPFKVNRDAFKSFNPITGELDIDTGKLNEEDPDIVGYGFYFRLTNGFEKTVYWSKEKCEAHGKRYSFQYRQYNGGLWKDQFGEMALKTVIKNAISKFGIMSIDIEEAIVKDQSAIDIQTGESTYIDNKEGAIEAESALDDFEIVDAEDIEVAD